MDNYSMNFRKKLLEIDQNLGQEEIEALKFLCIDFISWKKLEAVHSAQDIFQFLIYEDLLNEEDTFIIAELLYRIKCIFLLTRFGYTKDEVEKNLPLRGRLSEYRQMLYDFSERLTEEEVKNATFLLRNTIPKKQAITSSLELLISLEKQDLLTETNLFLLEEISRKISPELLRILTAYKEKQESKEQSKETAYVPSGGFYLVKEPSIKNPSNDHYPSIEESGSLRELAGSLHSFAANQDVKARNVQEQTLPLSVGEAESKPTAEKSSLYKMDGQHRGYCLIFNNINFSGGLKRREGSEKDAMALHRVFTWLGFDVKQYDNKTSAEIVELLKEWQSSRNWGNSDCLVCCILSHGRSGNIYGTDGYLVPIRTITSYFTAKQCPLLAKKPKLFFIQACQGTKSQQPVFLQADTHDPDSIAADALSSGFVQPWQMALSIPEEADFLLGMATVDGYYSFRHVNQGTWFIQALCDKLCKLVPSGEDILSILTAVNADVSNRSDSSGVKKQMPQPAYTLRKKLIFPVPRDPFPQEL